MEGFSIAVAILLIGVSTGSCEQLGFPKGFLFGAGSSAYQMEGAWDADALQYVQLYVKCMTQGKSPSFWDHWTHENPSRIADRSNADVSCDFYNKYEEDIQLMKEIGIDVYRMSISWCRILPTGRADQINMAGIDYYKKVLQLLLANGIKPLVTLYHWDHPQIFEEFGGWTNETMVDLFVDYAHVVFTYLGPWIPLASTINQVFFLCNMGYGDDYLAPGLKLGIAGELQCVHNMLLAHVATYRMYDKKFRQTQNGKIGMAMSLISCKTENKLSPLSYVALDYAFMRTCDHVAHPLVYGDYPLKLKLWARAESLRQGHLKSMLPSFTLKQQRENQGTLDHFDINYYYTLILNLGYKLFHGAHLDMKLSDDLKDRAEGLRWAITTAKQRYNNPTIFITENGIGDSGVIEDHERVEFFQTMLSVVRQTIYTDNCTVIGYCFWSFLEGFEYVKGYTNRYGIISIDHSSPYRNRTVKHSGKWWREFLQTRDLAAIDMSNVV